jgi:hypothetical protein
MIRGRLNDRVIAAVKSILRFGDTAKAIVKNTGAFSGFANRPLQAIFSIAGAKTLLQSTADSTGEDLTLTDLRSGKDTSITAATRQDAANALGDFLANDAFTQYGFIPAIAQGYTFASGYFVLGLRGGGGVSRANDAHGNYANFDASGGFRFGDNNQSDFELNYVGDYGGDNFRDNGVQAILRLRF